MIRVSPALLLFVLLIHLGTYSQHSFWQKTNGPYGGSPIWIGELGSAKLMAVGDGIYVSTDLGESWAERSSEPVTSVALRDSQVIYITSGALRRSSDGGETWVSYGGIPWGLISHVALSPRGVVLASTPPQRVPTYPGTMYRSSDGTDQWIEVEHERSTIAFDSTGTTYAGGIVQGIIQSTDDGAHWDQGSSILDDQTIRQLIVDSTNSVYAACNNGNLFRSTDQGSSWILLTGGLTNEHFTNVLPSRKGYLFVTTEQGSVFLSFDGGKMWKRQTHGLPVGAPILTISESRNGIIFVGVRHEGVFRSSDNGNTWFRKNSGWIVRSIQSLFVGPQGEILAGSAQGIFRSSDHGRTWIILGRDGLPDVYAQSNRNMHCPALEINHRGELFASFETFFESGYASNEGYVFRSVDDGHSWSAKSLGQFSSIQFFRFGLDDTIYAGCASGFLRSIDNGESWELLNEGISGPTMYLTSMVQTLTGALLVTTSGKGMFRSSDHGMSWFRSDSGIPLDHEGIITSVRSVSGHVFAGGRGLYRSVDDGKTWQIAAGDTVSNIIQLFRAQNGNLYASTWTGIFRSVDEGNTWRGLYDLRERMRFSDAIVDLDGYLYAVIPSGGILRSSSRITEVSYGNSETSDGEIDLHNFPNPFNPSTTISYSLPHAEHVSLTIYDVLGREIITLVNEKKTAGHHEVTWNAGTSPSGIYLCRMKAGEYGETRKLLLLR